MALKDVKEYYYVMLKQYVETKDDLADFEEALKSGYITEDKLIAVKEDVARMEDNLARIQYIMYLFELPQRKAKKNKAIQTVNNKLDTYFKDKKVDLFSIQDENDSVLTHLRAELKKLKADTN